jgi:DNA-binding NarL/FixJ family response regulator
MKVLVVDDSTAIRTRVVTLLRDIDGVIGVLEAGDAARALELSRAERPDFVILDLNLVGQSGLELLPPLKALLGAPIVVVLTNHSGEAYEHRCRQLGADHFFDKSQQFEMAIDVVRSAVNDRRQRT